MINSITLHRLELPLTVPYKLAFGDVRHYDTILAVVISDDGRMGFGEATILTGYTDETIEGSWVLARELAGKVISRELSDIDRVLLPHLNKAPFTVTALYTAIEMLLSPEQYQIPKDVDVPILGILNGITKAEIFEEIEQLLNQGFRTIKVKVGFDVQKDLQKVWNVQSALANRGLIRIDGNQGFSQRQACDFIEQLDPRGIELFEQPCASNDWVSAVKTAEISPVDMMLDESIYGVNDIYRAKELNAAEYIKVKLMKFGSMKNLNDSILLIKSLGMKAVLGNGVATDVGCWMEAIVASKHIDNAGEMNGFLKPKDSILTNPLIFQNGSISLSKSYKPILNMNVLQRYSIDVVNFKKSSTMR